MPLRHIHAPLLNTKRSSIHPRYNTIVRLRRPFRSLVRSTDRGQVVGIPNICHIRFEATITTLQTTFLCLLLFQVESGQVGRLRL